MGGHAGQPHRRLLGQAGAAVAVVGAGRVRVGAVGTAGPRVAAVDTVQATAGAAGEGGQTTRDDRREHHAISPRPQEAVQTASHVF